MRVKLIVGGLDHTNNVKILFEQGEGAIIPSKEAWETDHPLGVAQSLYESVFSVSHRFVEFALLTLVNDGSPFSAYYLTFTPLSIKITDKYRWVDIGQIAVGEDKGDGRLYVNQTEYDCIQEALARRVML